MLSDATKGRILGLFLVALVFFSPIANVISVAPAATVTSESGTTIQPAIEFDNRTTIKATDNISVWGLGIFPLRPSHQVFQYWPGEGPAHSSVNLETRLGFEFGGNQYQVPLGKSQVSFYSAGEELNYTFAPANVPAPTPTFEGQEAQLIAAKLTEGAQTPTTPSELTSILQNNSTAEYVMVENNHTLQMSGGTETFSFTLRESGQYVLFLANPANGSAGFTVKDGDLSQEGDVTIFGMDVVLVQKSFSDVALPQSPSTG
ncbi:MAG: hypothetical protein ABEI52_09110, partial [Halobacteriaceae archaeon]